MHRKMDDHRIFWREFRKNFATTGALVPSGRRLASALTRYVNPNMPQRILEVGPGTGAVTKEIVKQMGPHDELVLVEANESFVNQLEKRFIVDPLFRKVSSRCRILHQRIEDLPSSDRFDVVVSGLPLNNFEPQLVRDILRGLRLHLADYGTISFFQYLALRPARTVISGREQRQRLRGIARALRDVLREGEIAREVIWSNIPPATVHHLRYRATRSNTPSQPPFRWPVDEPASPV